MELGSKLISCVSFLFLFSFSALWGEGRKETSVISRDILHHKTGYTVLRFRGLRMDAEPSHFMSFMLTGFRISGLKVSLFSCLDISPSGGPSYISYISHRMYLNYLPIRPSGPRLIHPEKAERRCYY